MLKLKIKTCALVIQIIFWMILPFGLCAQETEDYETLKQKLAIEDKTALDSAYTKIQLANYLIYHDLDEATEYINEVLIDIEQGDIVLADTFYRHLLIKAWTYQGK